MSRPRHGNLQRMSPVWLVSTSHQLPPRFSAGDPVPYGLRHARHVGRQTTACGEVAINWKLFWLSPFQPWEELSCSACSAHVCGIGMPATG